MYGLLAEISIESSVALLKSLSIIIGRTMSPIGILIALFRPSDLCTRYDQTLSVLRRRELLVRNLVDRHINVTRNAISPKSGQKDCRKF